SVRASRAVGRGGGPSGPPRWRGAEAPLPPPRAREAPTLDGPPPGGRHAAPARRRRAAPPAPPRPAPAPPPPPRGGARPPRAARGRRQPKNDRRRDVLDVLRRTGKRAREVRGEAAREDRAQDRDAERTADQAKERRARGRDAEVFVFDRVLHGEDEHLHDEAQSHPDDQHEEADRQTGRRRSHP